MTDAQRLKRAQKRIEERYKQYLKRNGYRETRGGLIVPRGVKVTKFADFAQYRIVKKEKRRPFEVSSGLLSDQV